MPLGDCGRLPLVSLLDQLVGLHVCRILFFAAYAELTPHMCYQPHFGHVHRTAACHSSEQSTCQLLATPAVLLSTRTRRVKPHHSYPHMFPFQFLVLSHGSLAISSPEGFPDL
eukprot:3617757-Amphidinium_carterae.1